MITALRQIKTIGLNVVLETLRKRTFLVLAGSGLAMFALSHVLGTMSVGGTDRVVQNMDFWVMGMWGLVTAVFMGCGIIRDEIEKKTAYLILSRPVGRNTFLCGKFFGMLLVMGMLFLLLALFMVGHLWAAGVHVTWAHYTALLFIFLEWSVLASFSIFFAGFTSPLLVGFFLCAIYFLGHGSKTIYILARNTETLWVKKGLLLLYYLFPNLEAINFRDAALYQDPILFSTAVHAGASALCWVLAMFGAALFIFRRKRIL